MATTYTHTTTFRECFDNTRENALPKNIISKTAMPNRGIFATGRNISGKYLIGGGVSDSNITNIDITLPFQDDSCNSSGYGKDDSRNMCGNFYLIAFSK